MRLTVTDAHLQQNKYEFNNPKVSSPEMLLASKLDSELMTETTASAEYLEYGRYNLLVRVRSV